MMLANDLKTYYDEVRRYLDCPKDEQDRLLLSVNKQVIELQVDNPNLDYDGIVEFLGEPESLAASLMERLSPDVIQKFRKRKRMISTKKVFSTVLALVLVFCAFPFSQAQAVEETSEPIVIIEDLGDGIVVKTTITVYPEMSRNSSKSAISSSEFTRDGAWIATVTLKAYFTYNGITAGVTGTEYTKSLASGWSYTNHKITTTNVSSSSGGTATLTATLKDFPINVPVRLSLHCAPNGAITRG